MDVSKFLADTPQRADDIHRVILYAYFCLWFFSSALVRKKIFWLIFCVVVLRDVKAIYNPLTSQWLATIVYIACLFQIGLTPAGYENVPRGLKPQIFQPAGLQILIFPVIIEVRFVNSEFTQPDGRKKRTVKRFFFDKRDRAITCVLLSWSSLIINFFFFFDKKICYKGRWRSVERFSNKIIVTLGLPSSFRSSPVA